jgi:hypothetical protein
MNKKRNKITFPFNILYKYTQQHENSMRRSHTSLYLKYNTQLSLFLRFSAAAAFSSLRFLFGWRFMCSTVSTAHSSLPLPFFIIQFSFNSDAKRSSSKLNEYIVNIFFSKTLEEKSFLIFKFKPL